MSRVAPNAALEGGKGVESRASSPSQWAWRATLLAHVSLMAGLLMWCGWRAGPVVVAPLLAPLPGLLLRKTYTAAWASLLLVFYVAGLLMETYGQVSRHLVGGVLTLIAAAEFCGLMIFVRWASRERRAGAGANSPNHANSGQSVGNGG